MLWMMELTVNPNRSRSGQMMAARSAGYRSAPQEILLLCLEPWRMVLGLVMVKMRRKRRGIVMRIMMVMLMSLGGQLRGCSERRMLLGSSTPCSTYQVAAQH